MSAPAGADAHPSELAFATARAALALAGARPGSGSLPRCLDPDAAPDRDARAGLVRLGPLDADDRARVAAEGDPTLVVLLRVGGRELTLTRRGEDLVTDRLWAVALDPAIVGDETHADVMAVALGEAPDATGRRRRVVVDAVAHRHRIVADAAGAARLARASEGEGPDGIAIAPGELLAMLRAVLAEPRAASAGPSDRGGDQD